MTIDAEEDLFGWMQEREIIRLEKVLREIAYGQWDGLDAGEIACRMEEIAVEALSRETPE